VVVQLQELLAYGYLFYHLVSIVQGSSLVSIKM
jgi:hypothetical protein